jgi:hypothetical protein
MRVTPALCDEPRGLFAAIFSSAFKHPGLRDQLFGDQGFESPSLQRGVWCEPDFRGQIPSRQLPDTSALASACTPIRCGRRSRPVAAAADVRRDRDEPAPQYGSSPDSLLEGAGFEPLVPPRRNALRARHVVSAQGSTSS